MTDSTFKIDKLKLYFGEPFTIHTPSKDITVYQPTIGDIMELGEEKFYSVASVFIANSTMYRLQLWDLGVDWNDVSDFQIFSMLVTNLPLDDTRILFGDIDFTTFDLYSKQLLSEDEDEKDITETILYSPFHDIEINETVHAQMSLYIRTMLNIFPKVEKAKGKTTKQWIIDEERQKQKMNKNKEYSSNLLPLISGCLNHAGFKYKKSELKEVGIIEFMDSVQRLQIYESTTALLRGAYSGFMDTSKVNKEEFNFMREIKPDKK
jgi:hypothetical protein